MPVPNYGSKQLSKNLKHDQQLPFLFHDFCTKLHLFLSGPVHIYAHPLILRLLLEQKSQMVELGTCEEKELNNCQTITARSQPTKGRLQNVVKRLFNKIYRPLPQKKERKIIANEC